MDRRASRPMRRRLPIIVVGIQPAYGATCLCLRRQAPMKSTGDVLQCGDCDRCNEHGIDWAGHHMAKPPAMGKKPGQSNTAQKPTALQDDPTGTDAPAMPDAGVPSPPQIIDQLHQQRGADRPLDDKREADRYPWAIKLHVTIIDPMGTPREIVVQTHDLSIGGFSFIYNQFLHNGTVVIACIKALPKQPKVLCIVKNCVHVKGASHRVGVRFEKSSADR